MGNLVIAALLILSITQPSLTLASEHFIPTHRLAFSLPPLLPQHAGLSKNIHCQNCHCDFQRHSRILSSPTARILICSTPALAHAKNTAHRSLTSFLIRSQFHRSNADFSTTALNCQLMGMNCAALTDFTFSFRGFARRGGATDVHSHGWGVCFYDGRGLRAFHDPNPAAESLLAEFLQSHPIKTLNMVAHIRYATRGEVKLENVHPFQREMWGISWCFAHNGDVSYFDRKSWAESSRINDTSSGTAGLPKMNENKLKANSNGCVTIPWIGKSIGVEDTGERAYNPIGATDSEAMFCAILNALRARFDTLPTLPVLHAAVSSLCDEIVTLDSQHGDSTTILNFLLGCGPHTQFAYSWPGAREGSQVWNGLHYLVREPPFGSAHLSDCDYTIDFATVTREDDRVAVVATSPLTDDEDWVEVQRGQLILFDDGLPHLAPEDCQDAEFRQHGLRSDVIPAPLSLEVDMRRYQLRQSFFQGAAI